MNVGYLKDLLEYYPDSMPVYVACSGVCNYSFADHMPRLATDTFVIEEDNCLFITDEYTVEEGGKTYLAGE